MKENPNNCRTGKARKIIVRIPKKHATKLDLDDEIMSALLHSLFEEELKEICCARMIRQCDTMPHRNPEPLRCASAWRLGEDGKNHRVKVSDPGPKRNPCTSTKAWWVTSHSEHPILKVKVSRAVSYQDPETKKSLVSEVCPHCDTENTFIWDVTRDGMMAFCPRCGKPMLICSMCEDQRCGKCPHETK